MKETTQTKLAYTVGEAAKLLSLSRSFLYEAIQAGKLQSFKVGGARRISARQLHEYLDGLIHGS